MARVKMNAKHEYEFIANFKILQNVFRSHKIEKVCLPRTYPPRPSHPLQPIPVEKLVKCKMQYVSFPAVIASPPLSRAHSGTTSSSCSGSSASGTPTMAGRATTPSHGGAVHPRIPLQPSRRSHHQGGPLGADFMRVVHERADGHPLRAIAQGQRSQMKLSRTCRRSCGR